MESKSLNVLKNGLASLQRHISAKRDVLTTHLKNNELIPEADKTWLDQGEGNTVDEERVLDLLEKAPNYEQALQQLSSQDRFVVEKLQQLAAGTTKFTGSKREAPWKEVANNVSNKRARSSAC